MAFSLGYGYLLSIFLIVGILSSIVVFIFYKILKRKAVSQKKRRIILWSIFVLSFLVFYLSYAAYRQYRMEKMRDALYLYELRNPDDR